MSEERLVVCGGARLRSGRDDALVLRLAPPRANLSLRIGGLSPEIASRIPEIFVDLVEIACFVDAAEAATPVPRSTAGGERRSFRIVVPVRSPERWKDPAVFVPLVRTLGALTGDGFRFEFQPRRARDPGARAWIEESPASLGALDPESPVDVVPFSGGIDSFAGALDRIQRGRGVVLLAHRSTPRLEPHLRKLHTILAEVAAQVGAPPILFTPAWLSDELREGASDPGGREPGSARAFLWAALSAAIAAAQAPGSAVRFFENGVVGLGLPFSAAGLGPRGVRPTHPRILAGWARLVSTLAGRPLPLDNGFLWSTKAEVVRSIVDAGRGEAIAETISCTRRTVRPRTHCGLCAQCIDRRFATLAAGARAHDPDSLYEVDLLVGERPHGEARAILEAYVRAASALARADDAELFGRHGELARVLVHLPGGAEEIAERLVDLHRRHGAEVESVLDAGIREHATALRRGGLPRSCLLVLALPPDLAGPRPEAEPASVEAGEPSPSTATPDSRGRRRVPEGTLRILHLSDLHFSARRAWDQDPVLAALARDVGALRESGLRPDLVAVTGDVADRGTTDDYARATKWLRTSLLPAAGIGPERLLLVPGNHDVDRSAVGQVARAAQGELVRAESQDAIAAILADPAERAPLLRRHDGWLAFVRELGAPHAELPWWGRTFDVAGLRLHVAALCSSWTSWCDDDKGRLLVGRAQLHAALEGADRADLAIALIHHPWDYLADFDAAEAREALQRRVHVLLRGHLHRGEGAARIRPDGGALELACGACWGGATHPHGYHLVELEPAQARARLHLRTWDGHDWIADRNAYRGTAPNGIAEFPLRV
jgi:predicted MPP superfamily phosphohydrolase